jgi:hypothetical protein
MDFLIFGDLFNVLRKDVRHSLGADVGNKFRYTLHKNEAERAIHFQFLPFSSWKRMAEHLGRGRETVRFRLLFLWWKNWINVSFRSALVDWLDIRPKRIPVLWKNAL